MTKAPTTTQRPAPPIEPPGSALPRVKNKNDGQNYRLIGYGTDYVTKKVSAIAYSETSGKIVIIDAESYQSTAFETAKDDNVGSAKS